MLQIILEWIIGALLIYIAFIKKYVEAYYSEKGKAAATKEDIQEITKLVENVKIEFTEKMERLRGNLLFQNTIRGIMYTDKKEAVIKLYEATQIWYETIENHLVSSVGYNSEKLVRAEEEIEKQEFAFYVAKAKAELYIHEDDFFILLDEYYDLIIPLETLIYNLMIDYDHLIKQIPDKQMLSAEKKKLTDKEFTASKSLRENILKKSSEFRDACFEKLSTP